MKKIKILLLILSLGFSNMFFAEGTEPNKKAPTTLSEEVGRIMKQHFISLEEDLVVKVKFTINEYKEIVVLSVSCDMPEVRKYISRSLNNKTPNINSYEIGKLYIIPVRMTP